LRRRLRDTVKTAVRESGQSEPWARQIYSGTMEDIRLQVARGTAVFEGAQCLRVDFSGEVSDNYIASGSTFSDCKFSTCRWGGGALGDVPPVTYLGCDFSRADLRSVGPRFARFQRCKFVEARIDNWDAMCAEFVDCEFVGRIRGAKFSGRPRGFSSTKIESLRQTNEFRGNDFTRAELVDCSIFGGIDLDANLWPTSPDYVIIRSRQTRIESAKRRLDELPSDSERAQAAAVFEVYSRGAFALQPDLLVRRSELAAAAKLLLD